MFSILLPVVYVKGYVERCLNYKMYKLEMSKGSVSQQQQKKGDLCSLFFFFLVLKNEELKERAAASSKARAVFSKY